MEPSDMALNKVHVAMEKYALSMDLVMQVCIPIIYINKYIYTLTSITFNSTMNRFDPFAILVSCDSSSKCPPELPVCSNGMCKGKKK